MLAILFVPARFVERLQTNGLCNRPRRRFFKHSVVDEARYRRPLIPLQGVLDYFGGLWARGGGEVQNQLSLLASADNLYHFDDMRFDDPLLDTAVDECSIFRG